MEPKELMQTPVEGIAKILTPKKDADQLSLWG